MKPLVSENIHILKNLNQVEPNSQDGGTGGSSLAIRIIVAMNTNRESDMIQQVVLLGLQYSALFLPTVSDTFRVVTSSITSHEYGRYSSVVATATPGYTVKEIPNASHPQNTNIHTSLQNYHTVVGSIEFSGSTKDYTIS